MKKLIPLIILSPFVIVTFYFGLDKYITWLFGVSNEGTTFCSLILTVLVCGGISIAIACKVID